LQVCAKQNLKHEHEVIKLDNNQLFMSVLEIMFVDI